MSGVCTVTVKASTSSTYYLRVNCRTNVVAVYQKGFNGKYVAVKSITTSCGRNGATKAILGTHYTSAKYRWKFMHKDCYTQYATRITGHYLFHSVPYTKQKTNTLWYNSYNKLGSFASAGCVRMRTVDCKWIYDHCPLKTKVVVVYSKTDPVKKQKIAKINTKSKNRNWDPTDPAKNNPWKK
jgi:lipoprotein-anchoring transpeptidase ErfK/SrfK